MPGPISRLGRVRSSASSGRCAPAGSTTSMLRPWTGLQTLNRSLWAWIEGEYHKHPPSRHRGAHAARAMGARLSRCPLPRRHPRPRRHLPLRGQAPRPQGSHRQPERPPLRGRSPPRRAKGHLALRPGGAAHSAPRRRPRRKAGRKGHPPRRLRQYRRQARLPLQADRGRRPGPGAAALAAGHAKAQGDD